jgi:phosphatidylglycerol lysyltransferase
MEHLIVGIARALASDGKEVFNLGLAPLAGVGNDPGAGLAERGLAWLYRHQSRFYGFRGLHAFKQKFRPRWERRYLAWRSALALPRVLVALAELAPGEPVQGSPPPAGGTTRLPDGPLPQEHP